METVLVTGVSGFIAKHIALKLLDMGYAVRGTVRNMEGADPLRKTLARSGADVARLEVVRADLEEDGDWAEAVGGVDYIVHTASPFPLQQPRGRLDLVSIARGGTLRVLNAAKDSSGSLRRIILTSSIAAMMYRASRPRSFLVRESDWTDTDWSGASPYTISKTLAERAAWDWASAGGFETRLTTINPGFVLGPALDTKAATSLDVLKLFFRGAYPAVPPVYFPVVDVRDVAELHAAALTANGVGGRRLIACADTISMAEMATILKSEFPSEGKKIPTKTLPALAVQFLSLFDRSLKTVVADLHFFPRGENSYVTELTGVRFRPAREAVVAAGRSLVDLKAV